jgi:hypothetical protein
MINGGSLNEINAHPDPLLLGSQLNLCRKAGAGRKEKSALGLSTLIDHSRYGIIIKLGIERRILLPALLELDQVHPLFMASRNRTGLRAR